MPYRPPNRFTAGRPVGTAAADMNFMAMVDYSTEVDTTLETYGTDISGLTTDVGGLTTDVSGLTTDVGGLITDVGGLITDVDSLQTSLLALETYADDINADVIALDAEVGTLDTALTVVEGDVAELFADRAAFCVVSQSAASVFDSTNTNITFSTEIADPLGWHATGANNIIPLVAGYYEAMAYISSTGGMTTTTRWIGLVRFNTSTVLGGFDFVPGMTAPDMAVPGRIEFYNGSTDNVSFMVFQDSGGTRTFDVTLQLKMVSR